MTKRLVCVCAILLAVFVVAPTFAASDPSDDPGQGRDAEEDGDLSASPCPRVAIADFSDRSHARIGNLGAGFAAKLAESLAEDGIRVVGRGEIEALMQSAQLDPTSIADLAFAARELGVDLVVRGIVESLVVGAATLDLAFVTVTREEAHVRATAELIDASTEAVTSIALAEGSGEQSSGLSVSVGDLFSIAPSCDVCAGGLRTEREVVADGELVSIGYLNGSAPDWFGLEVVAVDGTFLRWLGWRFIEREVCETWLWNSRDALGLPVGPGVYTIRLRDGNGLTASIPLQVRPNVSLSLPSLDLVTVGTPAFDAGSIGLAVDDAVDQLAAQLLPDILARLAGAGRIATEAADETALLAQIAAVSPDGTVTVNVGALDGVAVGDGFEILAVDHLVFDADTLEIVAYDILETKGQIEIVEVRDRASTGTLLGEFDPLVGDLARLVP